MNSDGQWRKACILPVAAVEARANGTLGIHIDHVEDGGTINHDSLDCDYRDASTPADVDIVIDQYGDGGTYGFLTGAKGSWAADSPSDGYRAACAAAKQNNAAGTYSCRTVGGVRVVGAEGEAVVFEPGKYLLVLEIDDVDETPTTADVLMNLATDLIAAKPSL